MNEDVGQRIERLDVIIIDWRSRDATHNHISPVLPLSKSESLSLITQKGIFEDAL
jgi:hypothetical protein